MRKLMIFTAFAAAILSCAAAADTPPTAQAPATGVSALPAPDRPWAPSDIQAAASALSGLLGAELPRLNAPSSVYLDRLADPSTFTWCRDAAEPALARLQRCLSGFEANGEILGIYVHAFERDRTLADDTMRVTEGMISAVGTLVPLVVEFAATLDPNDPTYATRIAGLAQANHGLSNMMAGSITMLTERQLYSDAARLRFAGVVARVYPEVAPSLTTDSRARLVNQLQALARSDPNAEIRAAFAEYQ